MVSGLGKGTDDDDTIMTVGSRALDMSVTVDTGHMATCQVAVRLRSWTMPICGSANVSAREIAIGNGRWRSKVSEGDTAMIVAVGARVETWKKRVTEKMLSLGSGSGGVLVGGGVGIRIRMNVGVGLGGRRRGNGSARGKERGAGVDELTRMVMRIREAGLRASELELGVGLRRVARVHLRRRVVNRTRFQASALP